MFHTIVRFCWPQDSINQHFSSFFLLQPVCSMIKQSCWMVFLCFSPYFTTILSEAQPGLQLPPAASRTPSMQWPRPRTHWTRPARALRISQRSRATMLRGQSLWPNDVYGMENQMENQEKRWFNGLWWWWKMVTS